ncbi:hypothetical protein FWK35_00015997 [Aphis craccivora]|uniref:Uncharacterized protein n=1 Tax=Aphis craccivora TaxID=307492 RepID=A0A6G0YCV8_APHCR|nr:hypothetical protein FWK35_00015997 [Aphis craccivora]
MVFTNFLSIVELQMLIKKIVPIYSYDFLITIRITFEKHCIKFSSILIGPKKLKRQIENFSCL